MPEKNLGRVVRVVKIFFVPLLFFIWIIEGLVMRKKGSTWRINSYQVTPLFILLFLIGTYLIFFSNIWYLKLLGIYILTLMETFAITLSIAVALGEYSAVRAILLSVGDRKRARVPEYSKEKERIYRVVVTFFNSIIYFCILYIALYISYPNSFQFKENISNTIFEFFFYSASVFFSFNIPANISPISLTAKLLTIIEVLIGYLFVIFIFASIVSLHINKISKSK